MAKRLSEKQIAAIELLSRPKMDGKTYAQIAEEVGISERQLRNWRNDDYFNDQLKRKIVANTIDRLPEVMQAVPDIIINEGNAAMLRTLLQAHGMLTEKLEVDNKGNNDADTSAIKAEIERMRKAKAETKDA